MIFHKNKLFYAAVALLLIGAGAVLYLRRSGSSGLSIGKIGKRNYNLILISIDTVRDDCLQLYNPAGAPTPGLNRIASNGYLFTDVISQVPFTLPSHSTMLTGTYPMKHLVQENTHSKLASSALTLAEVMKQNGYQTAGFIGSIVLASSVGIGQGFDTYDDVFTLSDIRVADLGGIQKNADDVYGSFQNWFVKKKPGKFFAFVHFYDAHAPYEPPVQFTPVNVSPKSMYEGELRYVDSVIAKMYDNLAAQHVWDDTLLVITGDHGEMLGEHKEMGHGYFVYQQALRVPLIIVVPGQKEKKVIDRTVQIADVMPTTLDLLGIEIPRAVQGTSVMPLIEGKETGPRFAYSESLSGSQTFGTAPLRSIQDTTYKYIDTARPELYDIRTDKLEEHNLYAERKDLAQKMKAKLDDIQNRYSANVKETAEERKLSPEQSEQLAALGYIGNGGAAPPVNLSKDPKDYIEFWTDTSKLNAFLKDGDYQKCFEMIQKMRDADALSETAQIFEARAYMGVQNYPKAVELLEDILKKDPENSQAMSAVADAYSKTGQTEKAIAQYKELVEKQDSMLALQSYARHMMQLGRQDEIISYLDKIQKAGKLTEKSDEVVGEIYANLKDYAKARTYLTRSVENNANSSRSYTLLASVLDAQGQPAAGLTLLEGVKDRFSTPDYLLELGVLYHKNRDYQQEMATFQRLVKDHPKDARGYFYLGKAILDRGSNFDVVLQLAEKGLALKPGAEYQIFGNYLMADAYTNLGMNQKAEPFYAKAKEISIKSRDELSDATPVPK